jgi:uroporphyrinogen-III synthase
VSLPLQGKTVLVTRPQHQARDLAEPLEALGAKIVLMPSIGISEPDDMSELDNALRNLDRYDWVVLTSVNGVEALRQRMLSLGISFGSLMSRKIAVIGPSTARAVTDVFRAPDLVPSEYVSEAIASELGEVRDQRFLLARADLARRDLAELLMGRGAIVDEVAAYKIVRNPNDVDLPEEAPAYITLTSSEAVRATCEILSQKARLHWMRDSALACIGPITASTVRELGYQPALVARAYTVPGLVEAMVEHAKEPANV